MASSSIGMAELPYHHVPFAIDGSDAKNHFIKADKDFDHDTLLISGVKTNNDVMRGEETQLIGCITSEMNNDDEKVFIFPGTHSKHILVKDKKVVDFKTYMTGEFFELLSQKSILRASVKKNNDSSGELKSFTRGVKNSIGANLLHASFMVRTNDLFHVLKKEENYHYLSGLLIGTELQDMLQPTIGEIFLCCGSNLRIFYKEAFHVFGLIHKTKIFPPESADTAVIRGQWKIFKQKV
jgi:2-dehydro-3-deoxygalactonokinase